MTKFERQKYVENFKARRTSRLAHLTSGYIEQFGDTEQPAIDTIRRKDVGDDPNASVPRERRRLGLGNSRFGSFGRYL